MSDKFVFQNARIKAFESRLLSPQQLQRLSDCTSAAEVYKLLTEFGFSQSSGAEAGDFDALFAAEERAAYAVVKDFNVDGALDSFLLSCDYHNAKALMKAAAGGGKAVLMPNGLYDSDMILECVEGGKVDVSERMTEAISALNKLMLEGRLTPREIDVTLDKAMFADVTAAAKRGGKAIVKYFTQKIDYLNISTFVRCRRLGQNEKFFEDSFVSGGELAYSFFGDIYEGSDEALRERCKYSPYGELACRLAEDKNLVGYEVAVDDLLLKEWREQYNDMFSPSPIIYYHFAKLTELKAVKLVVAGIKNNVDSALIKERMREIYGA